MPRLSASSNLLYAVAEAVRRESEEAGPIERLDGESADAFWTRVASSLSKKLKREARKRLKSERVATAAFERRLRNAWAPAIDHLELMYIVAVDSGSLLIEQHRRSAPAEQDYTHAALVELLGRACKTASEIIALLRAGHAEGAEARWRTLHEVAITALFLEANPKASERYFLHGHIETKRGIVQYRQYASRLGGTPPSDSEVTEIIERADALCERFGSAYGEAYGWAAQALRKRRPTFVDIEKAVNLEHWRPSYKRASLSVHASAAGLQLGTATRPDMDGIMVGPSNAGLETPLQSSAISLCQTMVAALRHGAEDTRTAYIAALLVLCDEVIEGSVRARDGIKERARLRWERARAEKRV